MLGQFIPAIDIYKANSNLRKKNSDITKIVIPNNINQIDTKYLEDDYKATIETKNKFEDKAKTIIAALTIAITMTLNLSKMIEEAATKVQVPYFSYCVFGVAILSILYMLVAGIMSIQVLIKENILYPIPLEKRKEKTSIYQATQQNINQNLIRNNIIYAAYISIRNSVICLLVIFILAVLPYQSTNDISSLNSSDYAEIMYENNAVNWLMNNSQKKIDWSEIIQYYNSSNANGTQKNIYDKKQGIAVTIGIQGETYIVSHIQGDIIEFE